MTSKPVAKDMGARKYIDSGDNFTKGGKVSEAEIEYRLAVRAEPNNAEAHLKLGANLLRRSKLDEAEAELKEALRLRPQSYEAAELADVALESEKYHAFYCAPQQA